MADLTKTLPSPGGLVFVIVFLLIIDIIVVSLRFYTRRALGQTIKLDDWFTLVALVLFTGLATTLLVGIGRTTVGYPAPPGMFAVDERVVENSKITWIFTVISYPALWLIKASFLFFYRRIFVSDPENYRSATHISIVITIIIITLWALGFMLAYIFACHPVSSFWNDPYNYGVCVDTWQAYRAFSISDLLTDIIIIFLPVPMIWNLSFTRGRKFAILAVFMFGALAVAASALRLVFALWASYLPYDSPVDGNLMETVILLWSQIELNLGLLAACLPQLRGLFKTHAIESLLRSSLGKLSTRGWSRSFEPNELSLTTTQTQSRAHSSAQGSWLTEPLERDDGMRSSIGETYFQSVTNTPSLKSENIATAA